jgi:hypothetical protein
VYGLRDEASSPSGRRWSSSCALVRHAYGSPERASALFGGNLPTRVEGISVKARPTSSVEVAKALKSIRRPTGRYAVVVKNSSLLGRLGRERTYEGWITEVSQRQMESGSPLWRQMIFVTIDGGVVRFEVVIPRGERDDLIPGALLPRYHMFHEPEVGTLAVEEIQAFRRSGSSPVYIQGRG